MGIFSFIFTSFLLLSFSASTAALHGPKFAPPPPLISSSQPTHGSASCSALHNFTDYESRCHYIDSEISCQPQGFFNYLQIFYCVCGHFPPVGYAVLILWLILLFYLFATTTTNYFCPSLQGLSQVLNLSPVIAGTTLLPLGSGSTDVFSSIISFSQSASGRGGGAVGINCVLGGAFFISSVVSGVVSILVSSRGIRVDRASFVRDVVFFLFTLSSLLFIIMAGEIGLWGAIGFVSIYVVYVFMVFGMHNFYSKKKKVSSASRSFLGEFGEMETPLLAYVDKEKPILLDMGDFGKYDQKHEMGFLNLHPSISVYMGWIVYILELPLYLPRRLTIPVAREDSWSKPLAVVSVTLAPILLATLWNVQAENMALKTSLLIYFGGGLTGLFLGSLAFVTTKKSGPPQKCLLPWLLGEFIMSVTWTYMIAQELISFLSSAGVILGVSPSTLAFTVLAWGNSTGDLIADSAMAMKEGPDGTQIAISGCYAGPLFNTLVGLGISLVFAAWSVYPSSYVIPSDPYVYELLGFFMAALLWSLLVLVNKNMRLDWGLGGGLLAIYSCFLFLRFSGALQPDGLYQIVKLGRP